ncbi:DNA alkylation repair protein [Sporosarcina limicola]|uniref:3-methyladenine DNA glycosylase AlkC n=1 Tax=Sporosarcina limicola TaxID=34101 RepID=A0A927RFX7_9BACL|nr:DNA alkylation repair protein [Sporosarcina limicola]MBE1555977.1 3-methyladenine DNA glycosylase AlkC [Sporosarcina limicola]
MFISEEILHRKGASKAINIPKEVLVLLNRGEIESVNLTEWLAVNHIFLLRNVLPTLDFDHESEFIVAEMEQQSVETGMKAIRLIGSLLNNVLLEKSTSEKEDFIRKCSIHISDSVRCWAAFMNNNPHDALKDKLDYIRPFAADSHFGVREISWMSIREDLAKDIDSSVKWLVEWAKSDDENIRRFSVESIRPRGVWCKHIEILKQEPQKVLPILNLLKSDPSKYVQDSVGNWLNDASKTQPEWVLTLCEQWEKDSVSKATDKIIKKAKRTIVKGSM